MCGSLYLFEYLCVVIVFIYFIEFLEFKLILVKLKLIVYKLFFC